MIANQTMPWLLALVATWTVAIAFILLALAVLVPALWHEARAWLRPERPRVIDFDEARRRKDLNAASGMRP